MKRILLPSTIDTGFDLPDGVCALSYEIDKPLPSQVLDATGLVLWGSSSEWMVRVATEVPYLRWVQALSAGYEDVMAAGFAPEATICNGATLHDGPVAEHAVALVLACARRLDLLIEAQREHRWSDRGGRQPLDNADALTTLFGASVAIVGFGGIGQTLARHLAGLGAIVTGVARRPGERSGFPVVTVNDLDRLLPTIDILVLALPGTERTRNIIGRPQLRRLRRSAWVVNVGRGACLDQEALLDLLSDGLLGGAALDVFETEPLPADSAIWGTPNLIISPHAAGGRPRGYQDLISHNARALLGETSWRNVVRVGSPLAQGPTIAGRKAGGR